MPQKSPKLKMLTTKKRQTVITVFGFSLSIIGLVFGLFWESVFNHLLEKTMILRPDSKIFELWKSPPTQLTLDMYIFNWTNPEDFQNPDIKPKFEELGPYRFIEKPNKVDINWHPENASVSYKKRSEFYFEPEGSNGTLNDNIVTLNSLAVAISRKAKYWNSMRRAVIDFALKYYRDDLTLKKTAGELLFGGYEDMLINVASAIPSSVLDIVIPYDKYGYCYGRNGSAEFSGEFNIHTGADDLSKIGQIANWKYSNQTKAYPQQCSKIYGSTGEFQTPNLKENGTVDYFLPDLCRPLTLEYSDKVLVEGLLGYKYIGGLRSMDNGTLYPENACYCNGECVPSGLMNITSCWYGSSVFMSYPHFYKADPYYLDQVEGLKPDKEKHEMHLVLEPKTGYALEMKGRLQGNIYVEPMSYLRMFRNSRKIFFPLFWLEERMRITPDLSEELKILPKFLIGGKILGGLIFLSGLIIGMWNTMNRICGNQKTETMNFMHEPNGIVSPLLDKSTITQQKIIIVNT